MTAGAGQAGRGSFGVVGAGISGLVAARTLRQSGGSVTVFDDGPAGGKLRTSLFGGVPVDEGADAFIARVPEAVELCRSLGLDDELVAPAASRALLWTGGTLRPFAEGLVLGVPTRLGPLWRSGLVSRRGVARAGLDLVRPRTRRSGDVSVAGLVASRLGQEVAERLVDPLVGGIHAGRTEDLSAEAAAPQLAAAARSSRSLMRGLRPAAAQAGRGPVFLAPRGGMGRIATRLEEELRRQGVRFAPARATELSAGRGGGVTVTAAGRTENFDGVVLAAPARAAAGLLRPASPAAASELDGIPGASVALVTVALGPDAIAPLERWPGCSGFLVPRAEGRLMTACSIGSAKWPHWAGPDRVILRMSAGRDGDDRAMQLDDDELVAALSAELAAAVGVRGSLREARVSRWADGFPQYRPGHIERVQHIRAALARDLPGLEVAGAAYEGVGVPACIASGRAAAQSLLEAGAARDAGRMRPGAAAATIRSER